MLRKWLALPLTRELDLDDPGTTQLRQTIISQKEFLFRIYQEWYQEIKDSLPKQQTKILEIGSGAGFLKEFIPNLLTSEIFACSWVNLILDGLTLPFSKASLNGIVMTDVLHHIPDPRTFFTEAARCISPGGVVVMIEPWVSAWSRLIYMRFHHEPFRPDANDWSFPSSGPLSGANGALPWIIFARDRLIFEQDFPQWKIRTIKPQMPFRYLLSGGVSMRSLTPNSTFGFWRWVENLMSPWMKNWAMFTLIVLERV
jgi:SAM-dependent methyltransferase